MKRVFWIITILTGLAGLVVFFFSIDSQHSEAPAAREPLYWVAPMDPNFRRDGPGKSPMGMDLVPVYAETDTNPGEVRINPAVQQNLGVKTALVRRGKLTDSITAVGYLAFNESRLWHAYPRVEGWIDRLHVDYVGEAVQPGQVLFEIYSPALVAAQEEYLSALAGGNPSLVASSEARLRAMDVANDTLARIRSSRQVQRTVSVLSPQAGIVSHLNVRDGHFVHPGTSILDVAGLEDVWVNVPIHETDASLVAPGQGLHLRFDGLGGEVRHSAVDFISRTLDPVSRTLTIRGTLENPDGKLRPDMFATARIDLPSPDMTLLIPRQALIRTAGSSRVVLQLSDSTFKSVAVDTGRFSDDEVEVTRGLQVGDRVVTSAQFLIDSESSIDSDLRRMGFKVDQGPMDHGSMDHGSMDHGAMDHGSMDLHSMDQSAMDHPPKDHGSMDHDSMDHGDMNHSTMHQMGDPDS